MLAVSHIIQLTGQPGPQVESLFFAYGATIIFGSKDRLPSVHTHWGQGVVYPAGTMQIHHNEMDKVPTTNQPSTLQTHSEFSKPISLQCTQYRKCLVHSQCPRSCDCDVLIR